MWCLGVPESNWGIWGYLGVSLVLGVSGVNLGCLWGLRRAWCLGVPDGNWGCLGVTGGNWGYMGVSGDVWVG